MKRSRFTEEQIIAILKEQEAGMPTVEVSRQTSRPLLTGRRGLSSSGRRWLLLKEMKRYGK